MRRHALLSGRCLRSLIFSVYNEFLCMQNLILDFVLDSIPYIPNLPLPSNVDFSKYFFFFGQTTLINISLFSLTQTFIHTRSSLRAMRGKMC